VRRMVWIACLVSACSWLRGGEPEAPEVPAPPQGAVFGLELGRTTGDEASAWAAARGLKCEVVPSPRRLTTQLRCVGVSAAGLPERALQGDTTELVVAWPDGRPIHYVSTWRRFDIPADAIAAYDQSVQAVRASVGEPNGQPEVLTEAALAAKITRASVRWARPNLEVSVSALRAGARFVSLNEVWQVPGVEAQVAVRAHHGSSGATWKGDAPPAPAEAAAAP
jgi:hypothetical protein